MTLVAVKRDLIPGSEFSVREDYTDVKMPDFFSGKNLRIIRRENARLAAVAPIPSATRIGRLAWRGHLFLRRIRRATRSFSGGGYEFEVIAPA